MKVRKIICLQVFLFCLLLIPSAVNAYDYNGVTYNDNDFTKLQTFLNQPSAVEGKTNGQQLNAAYDANDPTTWTGVTWGNGRVVKIYWAGKSLNGDLDLSDFSEFSYINCNNNKLTSLDLSNNNKLETLECYYNNLNAINLTGCSSLGQVYCHHNWYLHTLDLSSCPLLYQLECYCDQLISINASNCPNLTIFRCDSNILTSLDIGNNVNLKYLNCNANYNLTHLDVSKNVNLTTLYCGGNLINSLDISNNHSLNKLYFKNTRINSFTAIFFGAVSTVTSHNGYLSVETSTFPNCSIVAEPVINDLAFKCWTLNGIPCSNNIYYSVRSTIIGELKANFVDNCNITVISNNTSYGTVTGGGQYDFDQMANITATPADGYYFVGWYENSEKYYSYYKSTFPMTHDRIITAIFAPIPTPTIYSIAASGYDSITLKWYPCDGATYYQVYRATSPNGTYYMESSGPLCSLEDTFLKAGQYYYYKVKAVCSDGYTTYSSFSSYKYAKPGPVPPAAPAPTAASYSYNSIKVSWNAVSGASGYELYKASSETGSYTLLKATTSSYYIHTSLSTGSNYYYKVRAYRLVGRAKVYGAFSSVTSAMPVPSASAPAAVSAGYTSNKISWAAVSGASGYELYKTDVNGEIQSQLDIAPETAISYTHEGLTTNTPYYYKVKAYRTVNGNKVYGPYSKVVTATPVPSAPTVKVTPNSYNSLNLTWNKIDGADKYEISRSTSSASGFVPIYTTNELSYTDSELATGITCYYKVRALIEDNHVIYGDYSKVTSLKVIPATPVLTVSPYTYTSLKISWNAVDGATGYKIYRATSSSGTYTYLGATSSTSFTSTGLATGKYYYYKVIAYRTYGGVTTYSAYSSVKYAKAIPSTPTATAASYNYNSIKVSWNAVSGASGYELYKASSETGSYTLLKATTSSYYIHTSLSTGSNYYYKVRAYRLVGRTKVYGAFSSVTSAMPVPSAPAPAAISAGYTSNKISWAAVSGASGYELYKTDVNGEIQSQLDIAPETAISYTHEGLTTNTPYYYKVKAYRTVNGNKVYGPYSKIVAATPVPSAPTVKVTLNSYNSLNITWNEIDGADKYEISRSTSSANGYVTIYTTDDLSYTDANLATGTTYYYKVRALIEDNHVIYGDYSKVTSLKVIPATPVLTVSPYTYTSLKISWNAVDGATGYKIYRATSSSGTYTYLGATSSTSFTSTGLATGKYYYYKVLAYTTANSVTTYSAYSSVKYAKVIPSTPTTWAASYSSNSIKVSWGAVSGATMYELYWSTSETVNYTLLKSTTAVYFVHTPLSTGNTYYYKVRAYHLEGSTKVYSSYSQAVSAAPAP